MARRSGSANRSIDWMTFSLYLSLIFIGWLMIYTVGFKGDETTGFAIDFNAPIGRQTFWIGISFVALLFTFLIDQKFWQTFAYLFYALTLLLLCLVLLFGTTIKGATSWFFIMGFSFQPAEIAKFGTCLAIASYLSSFGTDLRHFKSQVVSLSLFVAPMALILLQPDAGSALIFLSFFIVLYRKGMAELPYLIVFSLFAIFVLTLYIDDSVVVTLGLILFGMFFILIRTYTRAYWYLGLAVIVAATIFLYDQLNPWLLLAANLFALLTLTYLEWKKGRIRSAFLLVSALTIGSLFAFSTHYAFNNILEPHQQDRINVWLRPDKGDPRGSLYNSLQSKLAIGSGGLEGKGFLQGTLTKGRYVPEQSTDFIFCTIGEEQGFIGSFGVIALFLLLLLRITILAERQRSNFSLYYAYGVAGILFLHVFVNIGMTMGLAPIIGIPLPFISYGGSSLLGFTLMIGVLLKLDSQRYSS